MLLVCSKDGAGVSFLMRHCLIAPIFIVSERALKISTSGVLLSPGGDDVTRVRSADSCSFCITFSKLQKKKRKEKKNQLTEGNWQLMIKVLDHNFLGGGGVEGKCCTRNTVGWSVYGR